MTGGSAACPPLEEDCEAVPHGVAFEARGGRCHEGEQRELLTRRAVHGLRP